ncbi:MAG: hypothetical protein QGG36_05945 [Pirellulaceae bacterium]|jgi:hypothetical protein|nr:hypothetical protein [Pirellulaceae bacterium]MDP7015319.1 hypothetical protein [Pirellulaceae bacterium]
MDEERTPRQLAWIRLQNVDWAPPTPAPVGRVEDWLPLLCDIWSQEAGRRAGRRVETLGRLREAGARMTLEEFAGGEELWLGSRWAVWPLAPGSTATLLCSRLGKRPHLRIDVFKRLRLLLDDLGGQIVAAGARSSLAPALEACNDFAPVLMIEAAAADRWRWWAQRAFAVEWRSGPPRLWLSPRISPSRAPPFPLHDRAAAVIGDQWLIPYVRENGSIHKLLAAWESDSPSRGEWRIDDASATHTPARASAAFKSAPIAPPAGGEWMLHCTRSPLGAWPDESPREYFAALLNADSQDRSAIGALRRAVNANCIIGSSAGIRGGHRSVCLTAAAWHELRGLRQYRRHRQQWDFDLTGIAIDSRWLRAAGAKPVRYGDQSQWERMSDAERPYFQKRMSGEVDWSVQREWRIIGDLDLTDLPTSLAWLFTDRIDAIEELQRVSRWPVYLIE